MGEVKLGIRVEDVAAAAAFYQSLGFVQVGSVPGPGGSPLLAVLALEPFYLIVDALIGLPFADTERERMIKRGPRGLGCVIGLEVADLPEVHDRCAEAGCEFTGPVQDHPWGERAFTCVDPYGYEWKFFVNTGSGGLQDAASSWAGEPG